MSKKAQRFEQSSGWTSRPGGGSRKDQSRKPGRVDISEGSRKMADGGGPGEPDILKKERLLSQFRMWKADKLLGDMVRCPLCKLPVKTKNFETHVRRSH